MKTIILTAIILTCSVCFADPNAVDPNEMVSITLEMPKADFDTMMDSIVYILPIKKVVVEHEDGSQTYEDEYSRINYVKFLILNYLDKLSEKGIGRLGRNTAVNNRDKAKIKKIKEDNLKEQE
jgi:hypothetical protein